MEFYLNMYNEKERKTYRVDSKENIITTKFNNFDLTIFPDSVFDYKKITKYNIVVEKNNNRNFSYFKTFTGEYKNSEGSIEFEKCFIEEVNKKSEYRIYLEMYEGGLLVYDGKYEPIYVTIVGECADFDIDILGSKKIGEIFELPSSNEEEITVKLNLEGSDNYNTFSASVYIYYEEKLDYKFEPVVVNGKEFNLALSDALFKNNDSYVFVVLKDVLGNERTKKFDICKPESSRSFFYSTTNKIFSKVFEEEINLRFESRNCQTLTPVIMNEKFEVISSKAIGLKDKEKGVISFKLSDYFEDRKWRNLGLKFKINEGKYYSNTIEIGIDNNEPFVNLDGFDEDNYQIIKDNKVEITGTISDENIFFIGENSLECDFTSTMYTHVVEGADFDEVYCGEDSVSFVKYDTFSVVTALGEVEFYKNGTKITPKKITDFDPKRFFISVIDFNTFTTYEKNIINNQGGVAYYIDNIKTESETLKIGDLLILKTYTEKEGSADFDLRINNYNYSMAHKLNSKNFSCGLINNKNLDLSFETSKFVLTNRTEAQIIKYNNNSTLFKNDGIIFEGVNFFSMSLGYKQFFTFSSDVYHLDYSYNYKEKKAVYSYPKLKDLSDEPLIYDNYKMSKISDGFFVFSMIIRGIEGVKPMFLEFSDELNNEMKTPFIVESNENIISYEMSKESNQYNLVESDEEYSLFTNKKKISTKIFVSGENYKQKKEESFINVFDGRLEKRFKVFENDGARCCVLELAPDNEYTLSYGDIKLEKKIFIEEVDTIVIGCDNEVITGLKEYIFKTEIEDYVHVDFEITGNFTLHRENKNTVIIKKEAYGDFFEEGILTIKASDVNGLFKPIIKKVVCNFYSDDVLREISLNGKKSGVVEVLEDKFDLILDVYNLEGIKEIYYHDSSEYSTKQKAKRMIDGKIKGIITPYEEKNIVLYVTFKNLVTIKKTFNLSVVKMQLEKIFNVESILKNDAIEINIKNVSENLTEKEITIKNGNEEYIFDIAISPGKVFTLSIPYNGDNKYEIFYKHGETTKLIEKGIVVEEAKSKKFKFVKNTGFFVKRKEIIKKEETNSFEIVTNLDIKNIEIVFENQKKIKTIYKLESLLLDFSNLPSGIYTVDVKEKTKYKEEIVKNYILQIVNSIEDYVEIDCENFKNISFISTVKIKNKSIIKTEEFGSSVIHLLNGEVLRTYYPNNINSFNLEFNLEKIEGLNEYYYLGQNFKKKFLELPIFSTKKSMLKVKEKQNTNKDELRTISTSTFKIKSFENFTNKKYYLQKMKTKRVLDKKSIKIKFEKKHRFMTLADGIARVLAVNNWFKMTVSEKETILNAIDAKTFNTNIEKYKEEFKKQLKSRMEEI